jgi:hypothetical protein
VLLTFATKCEMSTSVLLFIVLLLIDSSRCCLAFSTISNTNPTYLASTRAEWDGTVVEGAHDDEFGGEPSDDDDDLFIPSAGFLSEAASIISPVLAMTAGSDGSIIVGAGIPLFDPFKNAGRIHQLSMLEKENGSDYIISEDDLEEMGGDPSFLDNSVVINDKIGTIDDDSSKFIWDGTIDEDAHND